MFAYFGTLCLLTALCVAAQDDRVSISLSSEAQLVGLNTTTVRGVPIYSFRGIPYAVPPVGELRYKDPVPFSWSGSIEAVENAPMCSQASGGQEDCLYLNVYSRQVPQLDGSGGGAAVMVYIHGGSLTSGSGDSLSVGPDFFLEVADVVFVTLNYRLGALGFLSTQDSVIRGNFGLKDQALALRWVQDNIATFGGDPGRVTLFGESAGSVSTSYQLLSPSSAGLFQQAIMQSGSALSPRGLASTARDRAFRLARAVGYQGGGDDSEELLAFLLAADAADLVSDDDRALSEEDLKRFDTFVFLPVVEGDWEGAFITDTPSNILASGRVNRVPLIAGDTSAECLLTVILKGVFSSNESMEAFDAGFVDSFSLDVRIGDEEYRREAAQKMRSFYFGDEPISEDDFNSLVALTSDIYYIEPVDMVVRTWVNQSTEIPVYEYQYAYQADGASQIYEGVSHGSELTLIFYNPSYDQDLNPTSTEDITRTNMIKLWTNFAKTGNPTPSAVGGVLWAPYGGDADRRYLVINATLETARDVYGARLDFLHSLLPLTL